MLGISGPVRRWRMGPWSRQPSGVGDDVVSMGDEEDSEPWVLDAAQRHGGAEALSGLLMLIVVGMLGWRGCQLQGRVGVIESDAAAAK